MSFYAIQGGTPLEGKIAVHGSKNSVLPILVATLLARGPCNLTNVPRISDVSGTQKILRYFGCTAGWDGDNFIADTANMQRHNIPHPFMREMRSSFVFLGAILARCGEAVLSHPGGCEIGSRPIDLHLAALRSLGAEIREESGNLICTASRAKNGEINLPFPSVGATENVLLFAVLGEGTAHLSGAACEPEIVDLANFLNAMGGKIRGAGTSDIIIEGVSALHPADHRILPDRIVAATHLSAVAAAGGDVLLDGIVPEHLAPVIGIFTAAGCRIDRAGSTLRVRRDPAKPLWGFDKISTMPYPGFPTDAQSPVMAAACGAKGNTIFVETIFESRYRHAGELMRMGANIMVHDRVAVIQGVPKLQGARVDCTDLRGGAALVVAALAAEGETMIGELQHIDRGYDRLDEVLRNIGAAIVRR